MPRPRMTYGSYAEMPQGLRDFVFSQDFSEAEKVLQDKYNFDDAAKSTIGDQTMDAIFGDTSLTEALAAIKGSLAPKSLDDKRWTEFLADYIRHEIWPIRDLFGDELTGIMAQNQVSTAGWPDAKVYILPMTYSAAATEIALRGGFSLLGPQSRERLRDLIMSRSKGIRIDAQVKEVLVRPDDFGGLGLDADMADKTVKAINQLIASVKVMSEEEYSDWLAQEARRQAESEARAKESELKTAEDKEIADIRSKMPEAAKKPATLLDEAVDQAYVALSWKPSDEYLVNRLRHIISSRLRDVRSALEVEQLLQRDTKVGGVGLEQAQARTLAGEIERAYAGSHDAILADEKKKIEQQLLEQKVKIEERKKREAEEHAKWYQEKILARKQDEDQKKLLAEQMRQSFLAAGQAPAAEAHPVDLKEAQKEKERFGEMVPAVAAGAAPIAPPPSPAPAAAPKAAPQPPAPFAPPTASGQAARPEVKVSKQTITQQPLAPGLKPRVDDVKFGPRLTSLVDELKNISLSEFRRLAKDPQVAAQKVMQKIETLAQESFEKRVQGVQAWQASPMQQAYLALVGESFKQGKSVQDIAEAKRQAGEDVPSPADIAAVISLNSKLHY